MECRLDPVEVAVGVGGQQPFRLPCRVGQAGSPRSLSGPGQPSCLPQSRAIGDVVLRIRMKQLIGQFRQRCRPAGIQINHLWIQMGRLAGHHLSEPPEQRTGYALGAFVFQHLRAPGDQPNPVCRSSISVSYPLEERQRAQSCLSRILGQLCGGYLRSPAVQ